MLTCRNWATVNHSGPKEKHPTRSYNITVTHSGQILSSTSGHPGTWNDKSIVLHDTLVNGVQRLGKYSNYGFFLFEYDENCNIVSKSYNGVWFICDNGYLLWPCTQAPIKLPTSYEEIRYSEWIESMRKYVECTIGILKGRFRILQGGIKVRSIQKCDELWKTCCALHNMLLFVDGLDNNWEAGGSSYWNSERNDGSDIQFSLQRLQSVQARHGMNMTVHKNQIVSPSLLEKYTVGGKRILRKMPHSLFVKVLV